MSMMWGSKFPLASGTIPPASLTALTGATGLDFEQINNIMKLVNKPEQDSLNWVAAYGYCQNIGDGRGITMGIFGATTGGPNDSGPDGPLLFQEYDKERGDANPTSLGGLRKAGYQGPATYSKGILSIPASQQDAVCAAVKKLENDQAWRTATWTVFYQLYWSAAVAGLKARGYSLTALGVGALTDCALNEGGTGGKGSLAWILGKIPRNKKLSPTAFLQQFFRIRLTVVDKFQFNQPPNGKHRVLQWEQLLKDGAWNLTNCDALISKVTSWVMH